MNIDKYTRYGALAAAVLLVFASAASALPAEVNAEADTEEDFNWTEASQFVDSFPFRQQHIDSLTAARHVVFPSSPLRTLPAPAFSRGELLVYDIGWSFVRAGYVILTATPDAPRRTIRLGAKALSRGFVSTFYRMRDYAISTVDAEGLYPLYFEEHLREGKHYKSNSLVIYDNVKETLYAKNRAVRAPKFTNDYLSVLYMARTKQFAPGDTFSLPFFVDNKLYRLMFFCKKRETMDYNGKEVRCLVVQPQPADDKGEFNRKKGLEIWLSDDALKIPLKIKAKITIGSITANLVHAERPKASAKASARSAAAIDTSKHRTVLKTGDTVKTHTAASANTMKNVAGAADTATTTVLPKNRDSLRTGDTAGAHDTASTFSVELKVADTTTQTDDSASTDSTKVRMDAYSSADAIFGTGKPDAKKTARDSEDTDTCGCSRDNSY